jgi:hypothetical protein
MRHSTLKPAVGMVVTVWLNLSLYRMATHMFDYRMRTGLAGIVQSQHQQSHLAGAAQSLKQSRKEGAHPSRPFGVYRTTLPGRLLKLTLRILINSVIGLRSLVMQGKRQLAENPQGTIREHHISSSRTRIRTTDLGTPSRNTARVQPKPDPICSIYKPAASKIESTISVYNGQHQTGELLLCRRYCEHG